MSSGPLRDNGVDRAQEKRDQPVHQFVGFRLDNQDYAIAITTIREIILMKPVTRLPQVHDSVEGLINLRGTVIPIFSLRRRLGLVSRPSDDETRTIVVNIQDKTVGCIVDEVTQVMRIGAEQIQAVPIAMSAAAGRGIAGLARLDDRLLIILDIEKLLDPGTLDVALEAGASAALQPVNTPARPSESGM